MNFADTWEVDENGNKFVFTVEMKRRLDQAGLPMTVESLGDLKAQDPAKVVQSRPAPAAKPISAPEEPESIQIDPATGKYIGTLKWYNPTRGYGFISRGGGEDIFFHKTSAIGDPVALQEGQWLLYDVEERQKGPEATEVEPYNADSSSEEPPNPEEE